MHISYNLELQAGWFTEAARFATVRFLRLLAVTAQMPLSSFVVVPQEGVPQDPDHWVADLQVMLKMSRDANTSHTLIREIAKLHICKS